MSKSSLQYTLMGEYAFHQGNFDEAKTFFSLAAKANPSSAYLQLRWALELARAGDLPEAKKSALQSLDLDPKYWEGKFFLAKLYALEQKFEESITLFDEILDQMQASDTEAQDLIDVKFSLSSVFIDMGQLQKSQLLLESILEEDPEHIFAYYYLGRVYAEQLRFQKALEAYRQTVAIDPSFSASWKAIGFIEQYLGNKNKSLEAFKQASLASPADIEVHRHLMDEYLQRNEIEKAAQVAEQMIQKYPDLSVFRVRLGLFYYQLGKLEQSRETLLPLAKDPYALGDHLYYLAVVENALGDYEAAVKHLKRVEATSDSFENAVIARAMILHHLKKDKKSQKVLVKAHREKPKATAITLALSSLYLKTNQINKSKTLLERAVAQNENDEGIWFALAETYEKSGNFSAQETSLKKVLALNGNHAYALNYLGYTYAERGIKLGEAEKLILRALELEPQDAYIQDSLAWVYYQKQEYQKAMQLLEQAMQGAPNEPIIIEHYAQALTKMKQHEKARDYYQKLVDMVEDAHAKQKFRQKIKELSTM
ncbi:MAG: tetratricopeptide repeat protein [Bdellovibrionales bacterium]|nr:tetratricopeptide repeat protein [Bdellovibrionales bacterium]